MANELPEAGINPANNKPVKRSTGWYGCNTIFGPDGSPYMTRAWIGRLRLHVFHRGDTDPDPHDHPWPFWTFPLTSYVEEIITKTYDPTDGMTKPMGCARQVVRAFRLSGRPATHCHRVLGRFSGNVWSPETKSIIPASPRLANEFSSLERGFEPYFDERRIVTIVWRGREERKWGFLKNREGKFCWIDWKEYVFGGGKDSPCQ